MNRAEVLRFNEVDDQGDIFPLGCLRSVENQVVPVTIGFNPQLPVGIATLHVEGTILYADLQLLSNQEKIPSDFDAAVAVNLHSCQANDFQGRTVKDCSVTSLGLFEKGFKVGYSQPPATRSGGSKLDTGC